MDDTIQIPGGYRVQFGDDAQKQFEELPGDLRARIQKKIQVASAVNPYTHGTSEGGIADRLRMWESGVSALVWVSAGVRVMTVVQIQKEDHTPDPEVDPVEFSVEEDV
jgi:hypothetical protein